MAGCNAVTHHAGAAVSTAIIVRHLVTPCVTRSKRATILSRASNRTESTFVFDTHLVQGPVAVLAPVQQITARACASDPPALIRAVMCQCVTAVAVSYDANG